MIIEEIARLTGESLKREKMTLIGFAGIVLLGGALFGVWEPLLSFRWLIFHSSFHEWPDLIGSILLLAGMVYIIWRFTRKSRFSSRAMTVVRTTPGMPHRLTASVNYEDEVKVIRLNVYYPTFVSDADPLFSVKAFTEIEEAQTRALDNTIAIVYANSNPADPVVIRTEGGVVVGERIGEGSGNTIP